MSFQDWLASVRQFLATRRPDIRFDDLDEVACQAAYQNEIAPITFVTQANLPLRRGGHPLPTDGASQDASSSRKDLLLRLAGLAILGLVICIAVLLLMRHKVDIVDNTPKGPTPLPRTIPSNQPQRLPTYTPSNSTAPPYTPPNVTNPVRPQDTPLPPQASNPAAPLPSEPAPSPVHELQGKVKLADAHLSIENDGQGHEQAVGRVLIENTGDYPITDFRLSLEAGTGEWALIPYEGSLQYPTPIYSRRIEPGGTLDVPVMTGGYYTSYSAYGVKKINIEASVGGPPSTVFDSATVL